MKKLLLILTLLITSVSFSQKEFQEGFTKMFDSKTEAWFDCEVVLIYNLNGNGLLFKLYVGEDGRLLKRTTEYVEGETEGNYPFTVFMVEDMETNEELVIQRFHDTGAGIRIIFPNGNTVQFSNE